MKHPVILAILICVGMVVLWHWSPLPAPEIIPLDEPVEECVRS